MDKCNFSFLLGRTTRTKHLYQRFSDGLSVRPSVHPGRFFIGGQKSQLFLLPSRYIGAPSSRIACFFFIFIHFFFFRRFTSFLFFYFLAFDERDFCSVVNIHFEPVSSDVFFFLHSVFFFFSLFCFLVFIFYQCIPFVIIRFCYRCVSP